MNSRTNPPASSPVTSTVFDSATTARTNIGALDDGFLKATASLRLILIIVICQLGATIPDDQVRQPWYLLTAIAYLFTAAGWWLLVHRRQTRPLWRILSPAGDIVALILLAALSGGATSLLQPVFFLLPVFVAFHGHARLTATVGTLTTAAYLLIWLTHPIADIPAVVWFHASLLAWLGAAATGLALSLQRRARRVTQLLATGRQLAAQTLNIEARQRTELAERLHDGPLQTLIGTRMNLLQADPSLPEPTSTLLREAADHTLTCIKDLRSVVSGLHPQVLKQLGLTAGLQQLADDHYRRTGATVATHLQPLPTTDYDDLLHSIARELLNNTAKHAHATHVDINLRTTPAHHEIQLVIADNGQGFDPNTLPHRIADGHIGLGSCIARTAAAGGHLTITTPPTGGTTTTTTLPPANNKPIKQAQV